MRYVLIVLGGLVVLVLAVVVIGWLLPVNHKATADATYNATPAQLFAMITDVEAFPKWRSSVSAVEVLPALNGHNRFRERGKNGSILYEVESAQRDSRLVTRIADKALPFGGTWTYELTPRGSSTNLRITEDGEVYNPVFRFVSRFVFGHTATIDEYLADIGRSVAQSSVRPRPKDS
jgi:uncharacterized protein YndB with AHSA1/START domain